MELVAIASFPKSGNTWVLAILSHLLFDKNWPHITNATVKKLKGEPYIAPSGRKLLPYKTHYLTLEAGPHAGLVHIIRHPLDVFLSQLNYILIEPNMKHPAYGKYAGVDGVVASGHLGMFFDVYCVHGTLLPHWPLQGTWFTHADAWSERDAIHLRYEDMKADTVSAFMSVARLFEKSREELRSAVERAAIATKPDGKFFWRQKAGGYRDFLSPKQIQLFVSLHGERMKEHGYGAD